jgi:hypothetical protein
VERTLDAASALGLLADPVRLRVVAALVLGARTADDVVDSTHLTPDATQRALVRLAGRGLLEVTGTPRTYRVRDDVLRRLAAASAVPRPAMEFDPSVPDAQRRVLQSFMPEGRLMSIPVARAKRRAVLDYLARQFDPGRTYPEREVNKLLAEVYDDFAALRRYLVDDGFLERRDGFYWRAGGTFDVG